MITTTVDPTGNEMVSQAISHNPTTLIGTLRAKIMQRDVPRVLRSEQM